MVARLDRKAGGRSFGGGDGPTPERLGVTQAEGKNMKKPNKIGNGNADGGDGKKNGDGVISVGPSKTMKDALKAEGLHIDWPDNIFVPVEGTFMAGDIEKSITFHFDYLTASITTSADVDGWIARFLYEAYMDCYWRYDLKDGDLDELKRSDELSWWSVIRLLEASLQKERRLSRFYWVATCVVDGVPVPPREQWQGICETIHITPMMATEIRECLMKAYPNLKGCECAKTIGDTIDALAWKLDVKESFNLKTGVAQPRKKGARRPFYKPMPQLCL
jgi:hypothetical protein